ncbi:SMI1/KNR4 family protein [Stigmatella erecta]|uniref:SMI1/KNR4 family protein n=1 Tax=Stigmatella erecta TaxID=83460 RepID=UPI003CCB7CB1
MQAGLHEVSRDHFPYPSAALEQIKAFEKRVGWKLDPDLRAFYLHCDGAELIKQRPGCPYRVLPLSEVVRARVAIRITAAPSPAASQSSWRTCCVPSATSTGWEIEAPPPCVGLNHIYAESR